VGTQRWFNTPGDRPLSLASLRGHVVLVDFWTYSCINCIRTLPYLNSWYAKYHGDGFVILGIHTPEFPFEHSAGNVQAAINQNGIRYPVAQDNNYATWNAYGNQYWPAEYLVDGQGRLRFIAFGEGDYSGKEAAIRSLLQETGARALGGMAHVHAEEPSADITPESYLGSQRAARFVNGAITNGLHEYQARSGMLALNHLQYAGRWLITATAANSLAGATLQVRFRARRVFIVAGRAGAGGPIRPDTAAASRPITVELDGHRIPGRFAGADVRNGTVRVSFDGLYRLVALTRVETHTLTLRFAPGINAYSFTFG
jgi:thiol-disulfide isomerase/thioredoxin